MFEDLFIVLIVAIILFTFGIVVMLFRMYKKVDQDQALIRNGLGGSKVAFSGMMVFPVLHRSEYMDISIKRIVIERLGQDGLVCMDNIRADIKVVFFVQVNKTPDDVQKVAQTIGCKRASDKFALEELFDAKFSEALKTAGKRFNFDELYTERTKFKQEIIEIIGDDLSGFNLEDTAIDFLEQTPLSVLKPDNVLDSKGIKKITEITSQQAVLANSIKREKEKVIKQQDVEAEEAILELERQLAETQEKQKREVATITAIEKAETEKIQNEQRLIAEQAKIATDQDLKVANENMERQVIVAQKNKEKTEAIENERLEKERDLEKIEKERILELTNIEKEKALEEERKNIQEAIRERVSVEKLVVEEQQKILDTEAFATAQRNKEVEITKSQQIGEAEKIISIKTAEANKEAAKITAEKLILEAEAEQISSEKKALAMKTIADAKASEQAAPGLADARVKEAMSLAIEKEGSAEANVLEKKAVAEAKGLEAKADAIEKEGTAEATVLERKAIAEAKGLEAKAEAIQKQGSAEANVVELKANAEANGIDAKADAMKKFDGVGREHEEFKLRLNVEKDLKLAGINIQKDIAQAQAEVIQEGLRTAKIDIVGGETMFFEKIVGSVTQGKSVDRLVDNSDVLTDIKDTFFNGDRENFKKQLKELIDTFGVTSEDLKNMTISTLLTKLMLESEDEKSQSVLTKIDQFVKSTGLGDKSAEIINSL